MKVALIIPSVASVKAFFIPLLSAGDKQGVNFTVFTSKNYRGFKWDSELPPNTEFIFIDFPSVLKFGQWFKTLRMLGSELRKQEYKIIHAHFILGGLYLSLVRTQTTKWITLHGVYHFIEKGIRGKMVGLIEKWIMSRMNRVDVLNQFDYARLKHNSKVKKVPLPGVGVDVAKFDHNRFSEQDRELFRKEIGVPDNYKMILFVGRFTKFKGVLDAVQVYEILQSQGEKACLVLCGGSDSTHSFRSSFRESIINLGWRQDIPDLMYAADCLIFPSRREGLPVSLLEAIAIGLPYVAYRVRGVEDINEAYGGGFTVEQGDIRGLASSVKKVLMKKRKLISSSENHGNIRRSNYVSWQLEEYKGLFFSLSLLSLMQ